MSTRLTPWRTAILGNRIFGNGSLEIDLYPAGVTANDGGDGDSGPNGLQNYPVLASAVVNGSQVTVTGTLNSSANTQFRIEFFASSTADSSGHGEAERYLGFADITDQRVRQRQHQRGAHGGSRRR